MEIVPITYEQFLQKITQDDNPIFTGEVFNFKIDKELKVCSKNLSFKICDFETKINLKDVSFDFEMIFFKCDFREKVLFNKCNTNNLDFTGSTFHDEFEFNNTENIGFRVASYRKLLCKERILFMNPRLKNLVCFDKTIFLENTLFENCTLYDIISFKDAVFNGKNSFKGSKFIDEAIFNDAVFEEKVLFHECEFNGVTNFHNTKFRQLADFYHATFIKLQRFYKTDFNGNAVFSRVTFTENVCFPYSTGKSNLIFRHANFVKGLDLSLAIINGQINFFNVKLENFYSVEDPKDDKAGAKVYDKYVEHGIITHKNKRETFRIIKDELISQNNVIDSLYYNRLEMRTLMIESMTELKTWKIWMIPINTILISFFSFISNNMGKSWLLGILFTLFVSILFFSISVSFIEDYPYMFGWGATREAFKYGEEFYFQFLIPTHKINYLAENFNTFTRGFYVSDFIGRIFISFGIYQTISAFRKFSKK